jgi:hypothetical protein
MCLALVSPYLLVASPNEFRRGAAVLLPFSLGIAVPLLMTAKWVLGAWIVDRRRLSGAAVIAGVIGVVLLRYPLELTQVSREGFDIGIALRCTEFPIREFLLSPAVQQMPAGEMMFVKQRDGRCMEAGLATVEVRRQLHNPTAIEVRSREELEQTIDRLRPHQYLVLDCGASARRDARQDDLCKSDILGQHTAVIVPAPPHYSDTIWTVLK